MDREFEVEIDGAVFKVKQIMPEEEVLGSEEAELVARACLFADETLEKRAHSSQKSEKRPNTFSEEKTGKVTEIFREKVTEKYVEAQAEMQRRNPEEISEELLNKRRRAEELSRYLSRDSRRYDGNFEMY